MVPGPAGGASSPGRNGSGHHRIVIPPGLERSAAEILAVLSALCAAGSPRARTGEFTELRRALFSLASVMDGGQLIDPDLTVPALPACESPHLAWIKQAELSIVIARALGLSLSERVDVAMAAALAHVGHAVLRKQVTEDLRLLDDRVYQRHLATHPAVSAELLADAGLGQSVVDAVAQHHEAWDGSGLPTGLKRRKITIGARIAAVADAHVETAERSGSVGAAVKRVRGGNGTALDPDVVRAYLRVLAEDAETDEMALTAAERRELERMLLRSAGPDARARPWRPFRPPSPNHQREAVIRPPFTGKTASTQALRPAALRPAALTPKALQPRSLTPPLQVAPERTSPVRDERRAPAPFARGPVPPPRRRSRPIRSSRRGRIDGSRCRSDEPGRRR